MTAHIAGYQQPRTYIGAETHGRLQAYGTGISDQTTAFFETTVTPHDLAPSIHLSTNPPQRLTFTSTWLTLSLPIPGTTLMPISTSCCINYQANMPDHTMAISIRLKTFADQTSDPWIVWHATVPLEPISNPMKIDILAFNPDAIHCRLALPQNSHVSARAHAPSQHACNDLIGTSYASETDDALR
jgi:hypothetical protein